jgi:hypothetical protein
VSVTADILSTTDDAYISGFGRPVMAKVRMRDVSPKCFSFGCAALTSRVSRKAIDVRVVRRDCTVQL